MRKNAQPNSTPITNKAKRSRNGTEQTLLPVGSSQVDHLFLATLRCDRLRVKIYLPNTDLATVGAESLFENTPTFISWFDDSMVTPPPAKLNDKKKSGQWASGGGRTTVTLRQTIEFKEIGVYIELDHKASRLDIEFQGRFWTLAAHPWRLVYNIVDYFKGLDIEGMAQVSRIDINRHFVGTPLELFPDPMSERFHFGFLPEGTKPYQIEGNIYFQKTGSSSAQIYDKKKQIVKTDIAVQEKFQQLLHTAKVPDGCMVSRFEVSIKGGSKALNHATYALKQRTLGCAAQLQRVFCSWVRTHRVLEASAAAKSLEKTRDYKKKKWKISQKWRILTTVAIDAPTLPAEKLNKKVAPKTRPGPERDKLQSLVRRTTLEAFKRGVTKEELDRLFADAIEPMCSIAADDIVARDLAKRTLQSLSPQERRAGDAPPEWMAQLLRPHAALVGLSISRQESHQSKHNELIKRRKKSWQTLFCPHTVKRYKEAIRDILLLIHSPYLSGEDVSEKARGTDDSCDSCDS